MDDKLKLKPEVKELWLNALRSGEYQQGSGSLNRDGRFCCLGVLCDLAVKAGVIPEPVLAGDSYCYGAQMEEGILPNEVISWAYANHPEGRWPSNPNLHNHALAEWNDEEEADFAAIAGLIEAGL